MELTLQSAKTIKGEKQGYLTGILYLAAADSSGVMDLCPYATPQCKDVCLGHTAGRMVMHTVQKAQLRRTLELHGNRQGFLKSLDKDIRSVINRADKKKLIPCFRLNGTSDLPWLAHHFSKYYNHIQFYDYTKIPEPWKRITNNYHLTFSLSESNEEDAVKSLQNKVSVAVVFNTKRGMELPNYWNGYQVIDGDTNDLRFLDPSGCVVGLRAKGTARKLEAGGFVQIG